MERERERARECGEREREIKPERLERDRERERERDPDRVERGSKFFARSRHTMTLPRLSSMWRKAKAAWNKWRSRQNRLRPLDGIMAWAVFV